MGEGLGGSQIQNSDQAVKQQDRLAPNCTRGRTGTCLWIHQGMDMGNVVKQLDRLGIHFAHTCRPLCIFERLFGGGQINKVLVLIIRVQKFLFTFI